MHLLKRRLLLLLTISMLSASAWGQTGEVRGIVYDKKTAEPIIAGSVYIKELLVGAVTDVNGFYSITKLAPGKYTLMCTYVGYDTLQVPIEIKKNKRLSQDLFMTPIAVELGTVRISGERQKKKTQVSISKQTITPLQLKRLPAIGGEPDLVQLLQIMPGVNVSGDQGGQLYIRGGTPIMNKVLLDGMVIYNPFHSIGLFSVFDPDIIKNAELHSAGFNVEYGGRISAVLDVATKDGNKKRTSGKLSANPFTAKAMLEGPLKEYKLGGSSASYVLSYKTSYLDRTSDILYSYADSNGLPYSFNDLYGKLSFNGVNGSRLSLFGFNFNDQANFQQTALINWKSSGFGANFFIVPDGSSTIINGVFAFSNYGIEQQEADQRPRQSDINGFNAGLNFKYFIGQDELTYGIELLGFRTDFRIFNSVDREINQLENTTELGTYMKYKITTKKWLVEPGLRAMYYASLGNASLEPRLGLKYNATDFLRFKMAGGYYSQNLVSAVSDRDVVNLFYGFLSGSDNLQSTFDGREVNHRLQKSRHAVAGVEIDVGKYAELNIEGYIKDFTQLTNINRNKIFDDNQQNVDRPDEQKKDFIIETGQAYGGDILYKYEYKKLYIWAVYSLNFVTRFDGTVTYSPHFDRRHNVNLVGSYNFGKKGDLTVSVRWNYGSGFPFTLTQGFYEYLNFQDGIAQDYTTDNGELGIQFADLNTGRLPHYHRLDMSAEKVFKSEKGTVLSVIASVTNIYDRENIFYFDRVRYQRVNQLPIMPSLGINFSF